MRFVSKGSAFSVVALLVVGFAVGCGGGVELAVPDLTQHSNLGIAPFLTPFDADYGRFTSRDLGNQLQIYLKRQKEGFEVVFDESSERTRVTDVIKELGLTLAEVYADPKLAGRVAEGLGVDLLLVGQLREPKITTREDDSPVYDMSQQDGLSAADTKYFITWQNATIRIWTKLVNRQGDIVWQSGTTPPEEPGHIQGYLKYATAYKSSAPERPPVSEEQIYTHLRDHAWRLVANRLIADPARFPEIKLPLWKAKPDQEFKTTGGVVEFR